MPALSEHSNVYSTAVSILRKKGFNLWYDKATDHFFAEKDGWDFCSDSPCGLLGLVAIYDSAKPEGYSEYWWREPNAVDYTKLPSVPPDYKSVVTKRGRDDPTKAGE